MSIGEVGDNSLKLVFLRFRFPFGLQMWCSSPGRLMDKYLSLSLVFKGGGVSKITVLPTDISP